MKIILSTRNPSKAEQIKSVFKDLPILILTLTEADIEGDAIEDGTTLQENSLKKALFAHQQVQPKTWAMADDTGLFINVLNGVPGINSARWAGENATTEEIMQHTLKLLENSEDRSAFFETVVALISPEGEQYFFNGKVCGTILESPRTTPQPKMPYSSIFMPDGENLTWAEMDVDYENNISHRGKAFKQVRDFCFRHKHLAVSLICNQIGIHWGSFRSIRNVPDCCNIYSTISIFFSSRQYF